MKSFAILAGAALIAAMPALAATTVTTTTTTVTQSVAPAWVAPSPVAVAPAPVLVAPPPQTVIVPPVTNSGDSGLSDSAVGTGLVPRITEVWREYYTGPDGLMHQRTVTRSRAP